MEKTRNWVNTLLLAITCTLTVFLVVGAIWQVVSRFILQNPSVFTEEVLRFSFIWVGLLGASYAFGAKEHLALTFLFEKWKPKDKKVAAGVIEAIVLLFMITVFVIGGIRLVLSTLSETSPVLGLPMGFVYSAMPISGCCTVFYIVSNYLIAKKAAQQRREVA